VPTFLEETSVIPRDTRRYFLYTLGKIGLTLLFLLLPLLDALEEMGQSKEIPHLEGGAPSSQNNTGVWGHKTGPGCWECSHLIRGLVKRDAIFAPIVAVGEDLKLLPIQGMEGMGNGEKTFRERWRPCS